MPVTIALRQFEAFVFDLDGVVTRTAVVHAAAWKRALDELLERLGEGRPWTPFDIDREYRLHVDGKARRDGIRSFLAARDISLAEGGPGDGPDANTLYGVAARKNRYFVEQLSRVGVEVYADATRVIRDLRAHAIKTAMVTASEHGAAVLTAAHLIKLFDVRVDGLDIAHLGLRGKPAPDTFLEATRRLGANPRRCVVIEDSIAGIRAGRAAEFGLVIGVDRVGHADALRRSGADVVVTSLDDLVLTDDGEALELR